MSKNILISGASLAGPATAYWLTRTGHRVTVVERAPALREGGQAVDFRGEAHLTMLRRMGILEEIRRWQTEPSELQIIDGTGRVKISLPASFTGGAVEITRGDLSRLLHDMTKDRAEYIFNDSIAAMTERADGVHVTFESGLSRTFDLVIGADGLHSIVRRLAFGPEERFVRPSGYYAALFSTPNPLGRSGSTLLYSEPGRGGAFNADADGAGLLCVFASEALDYHHRDVARQKELVARAFAGMGWEMPTLMSGLAESRDFYFDSISMVHMEHFTQGRVALVGDAGYGATMGGMGAGMSMIAAYVLAGELAAADGDHVTAFARYQETIRPYAKACQKIAGNAGPFFAPRTARGIKLRDLAHRVLTKGPFLRLLDKMSTKAANSIELKDYRI
ncbi:FAD-dependent oxidoreductase [Nonomuraea sp. NN258]|uniref:FAD-dependent monooxygenase n=1 Tax=Nonomuraea antri TaxID=2730852 RepID=UPI00156854AE|nr:FAD-dependent monooxygenase [Nonomuraea antri]NRQ32296.1 FAD-dependent oxidoreductase [Nonomuraea antri]